MTDIIERLLRQEREIERLRDEIQQLAEQLDANEETQRLRALLHDVPKIVRRAIEKAFAVRNER